MVQHSREETAQDVSTRLLRCISSLQSREAQEIEALRCPGQFWKLLEQQQNGVKERVVIIFNGPLNPAMRSPSPGIWRTRIAIKEEVLRQKVHLDVKYYSFNCENRSVASTALFLRAKHAHMPR